MGWALSSSWYSSLKGEMWEFQEFMDRTFVVHILTIKEILLLCVGQAFLTPAAEKTKNSRAKLKQKTQPLGGRFLLYAKLKKTNTHEITP